VVLIRKADGFGILGPLSQHDDELRGPGNETTEVVPGAEGETGVSTPCPWAR
jgi:hypothetical protein